MPERTKSDTVQLKVRMKEPLRAALEEASERRGVSMNAEIVQRLERSFTEEESLGGPGMRRLAYSMIVAFTRAGRLRAGGKENWIDDPDCYRAGVFGVVDALLIGMNVPPQEVDLAIESLRGKLMSRVLMAEQQK